MSRFVPILAAAALALLTACGAGAVRPPAAYTVPEGARSISTGAELATALENPAVRDIVLEDGVYSGRPMFWVHDQRIWARHPGKAIFHSEVQVEGDGVILQGLRFEVTKALAPHDVAIRVIGPRAQVLDVTIEGRNRIGVGLRVSSPEGFVGRRITGRRFTDAGIVVDTYPTKVRSKVLPVLSDIDVAYVARPVPRSSNGTGEACLWVGTPARVDGAKLRHCAWDGLWTGFDATRSTFSNIDVDYTPVGVYAEHYAKGSRYVGIHAGRNVRVGFNCEWADPEAGGLPACDGVQIERSVFESSETGVFLDEGTVRTSIRTSVFRNQARAAIVDYRGRANAFGANDFSGIRPGASAVSHDHG